MTKLHTALFILLNYMAFCSAFLPITMHHNKPSSIHNHVTQTNMCILNTSQILDNIKNITSKKPFTF